MKRYLLSTAYFLLLTLASCTSEQQKLEQAITAKEKELYGDSTMKVDFSKAKDMIALYADFVKKYPDDEKAEDYLFKAADISKGVRQFNIAIKYLEQYYEKYPKGEKAALSLFLQGFIYDNDLNNDEKAKFYYEKFLREFPTNEFADDAKASIAQLGKSDAEIIREFEAKLKGDSATATK